MQVLIIDDEKELVEFLHSSFLEEGFQVDTAYDGESGLEKARAKTYDLIILDNVMPKKDGKQVCRELRSHNINTPVIMLSVQSEVEDKVEVLEIGADDYLTKPFSFAELLARIKAVARRSYDLQGEVLQIGDLAVNLLNYEVYKGKERIYLTSKEYLILVCLMKNNDKVVTREEMIRAVWDENADIFSNTLEAHIANIRKKLSRGNSEDCCIETIIGRGYKIK